MIERFVPVSEPLLLAVDLTVFKRSGRKVYAARWLYDGAGPAKHRALRFGNGFMVLGVLVRLPGLGERVWCLPVLARLWLPGPRPRRRRKAPEARKTQPELARELIELIAARYPHRRIDVVGDGAFAATALRGLPAHVTLTVRLRLNAVIHAEPAPSTGPGRPRKKGDTARDRPRPRHRPTPALADRPTPPPSTPPPSALCAGCGTRYGAPSPSRSSSFASTTTPSSPSRSSPPTPPPPPAN